MEIAHLRLKAKNKERKTKLSMETTKPEYFDSHESPKIRHHKNLINR
jgi:hypothetical protein